MAKISRPPVPLKMYKHFAVVTVALTLTIAVFADGENRQAVSNHIEEREREAQIQAASQQITGPPLLIERERGGVGSFGDEGIDGFGRPMDESGSSGGSTFSRRSSMAERQALPNMTRAEVAALSDEEYERLRRLYISAGAIEDIDQSAHLSAVEDASARRMGHGGSDS